MFYCRILLQRTKSILDALIHMYRALMVVQMCRGCWCRLTTAFVVHIIGTQIYRHLSQHMVVRYCEEGSGTESWLFYFHSLLVFLTVAGCVLRLFLAVPWVGLQWLIVEMCRLFRAFAASTIDLYTYRIV